MRTYNRANIDKLKLSSLLSGVYTVEHLTKMYAFFLQNAVVDEQQLEKLRDELLKKEKGKKKILKPDRVRWLVRVFENKKLCQAFCEAQTALWQKLMGALAWKDKYLTLDIFENKIGKKVAVRNADANAYWTPFLMKESMELALLDCERFHYGTRQAPRSEMRIYLPEALRLVFQKVFPPPPEYELSSVKRRKKTEFSYTCESTALQELGCALEFIRQGHLSLKKNGDPSVRGLRDLIAVTGMKEFYQSAPEKVMELLKVRLLSSVLLDANTGKIDMDQSPEQILRLLFVGFVRDKRYIIADLLLEHLRTRFHLHYGCRNVKKDLLKLMCAMPTTGWLSVEAVSEYCMLHNVELLELGMRNMNYRLRLRGQRGDTQKEVDEFTFIPVVQLPLLKCFFFLTSVFGMTEIAYDRPVNKSFQRPHCDYLSIYDGCRYVRLTELGSYVIGNKEKYTVVIQQQDEVSFSLDETRLLLTMDGRDPITTLTLERMLEPVGTGRYMMSFDSLFKECASKKDVQEKIALFRRYVVKEPPGIWEDFFSRALARINPFSVEKNIKVLKIKEDRELLRLLASDAGISSLILKVEGFRIAVKSKDVPKLIKQLKGHGYFISSRALNG